MTLKRDHRPLWNDWIWWILQILFSLFYFFTSFASPLWKVKISPFRRMKVQADLSLHGSLLVLSLIFPFSPTSVLRLDNCFSKVSKNSVSTGPLYHQKRLVDDLDLSLRSWESTETPPSIFFWSRFIWSRVYFLAIFINQDFHGKNAPEICRFLSILVVVPLSWVLFLKRSFSQNTLYRRTDSKILAAL